MDPGSIIAAIDTALGVCGHVVELFQAIKDIRELPDAFKQLGTKIALVEEILNKTRDVIVARTDEGDREVAMQAIKSCQEQIQQLQDILETIQNSSGDPQADSSKIWSSIKKFYRNAVLRLGKGSKGRVEDLTREILESLRLLSQWCGLEDQLKKAMDDINNVEASLEDEECEPPGSNTLNIGGNANVHGNTAAQSFGNNYMDSHAPGSFHVAGSHGPVNLGTDIFKAMQDAQRNRAHE